MEVSSAECCVHCVGWSSSNQVIASFADKLRATCVRTLIAMLSLFLPHVESGACGRCVACVARANGKRREGWQLAEEHDVSK